MPKALILIALLSAALGVVYEISSDSAFDREYQNLSALPFAPAAANPACGMEQCSWGLSVLRAPKLLRFIRHGASQ